MISLSIVAVACAPEPAPAPSLTAPPEPLEAASWLDLTWSTHALPVDPLDVTAERAVAVAADTDGFVVAGYHENGPTRDGLLWQSTDGASWESVGEAALFKDVELLDVVAGSAGFVAVGVTSIGPQGIRPQAVFFQSDDGRAWRRLPLVPGANDSYPGFLTSGDRGYLAAGVAVDGGSAVWISSDGRSWERVAVEGDAASGFVDPQAISEGFLAVSWNDGTPPVLLRSHDGIAWTATPIDADADAVVTRLVVGRWGLLAQGLLASGCGPLASCPGESIAWWSGDGATWGRLPLDDAPTANGGSIVVPAGDHGFIAIDGASAWASTTGWHWTALREPGDGSIGINDAIVRDDIIVAVGEETREDGSSVGRILIGQ